MLAYRAFAISLTPTPKYFLFSSNAEHTDKVLCVDWSLPEYVVSGGADNKLSVFNVKSRTAAA